MKYLIINKHWGYNKDYNFDKLLYLLIDRPYEINSFGDLFWENKHKQFHRDYDLPAIIYNNGDIAWYKNSIRHRENNKPSYINNNGYKQFW